MIHDGYFFLWLFLWSVGMGLLFSWVVAEEPLLFWLAATFLGAALVVTTIEYVGERRRGV